MPIDVTDQYIRARVRFVSEFQKGTLRTVVLSEQKGISSVQGKLKGQAIMTVQSYLFDRSKWDMTKVKKWLKEHDITVKEDGEMYQIKSESFEAKFDMPADEPTFKIIKDDQENVVDYIDVKIEGYANTFELDRGNAQTVPGCFLEHLGEYKENPILLADHERSTRNAIGRVFSAYEDDKGLKVSARLSNAPDVRDIRFKVAEGVLKTFSIGGMFHVKYAKDKNYIDKVELREISIVTVPMNINSMFVVKQDDQEKQNAKNQEPENMAQDEKHNAQGESGLFVVRNEKRYKLIK